MQSKHLVAPDLGSGLTRARRPAIEQAAFIQTALYLTSAGLLSSRRMEAVPCDLLA